jgi:hypothetical protein
LGRCRRDQRASYLSVLTGQAAYSVKFHEERGGNKYEKMATSPSKLFLLFSGV